LWAGHGDGEAQRVVCAPPADLSHPVISAWPNGSRDTTWSRWSEVRILKSAPEGTVRDTVNGNSEGDKKNADGMNVNIKDTNLVQSL
jgi:hypothetical protein